MGQPGFFKIIIHWNRLRRVMRNWVRLILMKKHSHINILVNQILIVHWRKLFSNNHLVDEDKFNYLEMKLMIEKLKSLILKSNKVIMKHIQISNHKDNNKFLKFKNKIRN